MRTICLCLLLLCSAQAQSVFLEDDEYKVLRKGENFTISYGEYASRLSYDIWTNTFKLYNETINRSFSAVDSVFYYMRDSIKVNHVVIEPAKKKRETNVFLIDWVSDVLQNIRKRKIEF